MYSLSWYCWSFVALIEYKNNRKRQTLFRVGLTKMYHIINVGIHTRVSKFLTQDCRKSIYRWFIAANFNYCPICWILCGKKNTSKQEKLQERAIRLVFFFYQYSSYDDLLKREYFPSLKAYRINCLAVEVFKCVHGFNPAYLNRLFTEPLTNYNFRGRLNQPKFHTYACGFRSFRYSGSKLWNSLPRAIKNTNDTNEFKKTITAGLVINLNWIYFYCLQRLQRYCNCVLRFLDITSALSSNTEVRQCVKIYLQISVCVRSLFNHHSCVY